MKFVSALFLAFLAITGVWAQLPDSCTPLNDQPLATSDPGVLWGYNSELQDAAPPYRVGSWSDDQAIPTHHFANNQATNNMVAIQQFPYMAWLSNAGIAYDAYTLDRWSAADRQETMLQQTPSRPGEPWEVVESVGTNMRQMAAGPDGNPKSAFKGRSGVEVQIPATSDPVWEDFSDLHANWVFTSVDTGATMEVPMVRGSPILTHLIDGANPTLIPYCLSSVNGQDASYQCPIEAPILDRGSGYLDGSTCSGDSLNIIFRSTKAIDITRVQYAASELSAWPGDMITCSDECTISDEDKRIDIVVPGSGTMAFAINYIGAYLVPPNWTEEPATATCSISGSSAHEKQQQPPQMQAPANRACATEFCHTPSCTEAGSSHDFELVIELSEPIEQDMVQFAVDTADNWVDGNSVPPMMTCGTSSEFDCSISSDGLTITYANTFDTEDIKYAVNVVGRFVRPQGDWGETPYAYTCYTDVTTTTPGQTTSDGSGSTPSTPPVDPAFCADTPTIPACPMDICQYKFVETASDGETQNVKIVAVFKNPIDDITSVQVAFNTITGWEGGSHPMVPCSSETCSLSSDGTQLTYCRSAAAGGYAYAFNIIGFVTFPSDWVASPYWIQAGGSGTDLGTGTKFVLELDEPGADLPDQTRRYGVYFSEEMSASFDADGLKFQPTAGGDFSGWLQLAYLGAKARGDDSGDGYFDSYVGTYSYKPQATYCVEGDLGYTNFDWDKQGSSDLLMIALPHHEAYLEGSGDLLDTPMVYKGFVADSWLLVEDPLPTATMLPDESSVEAIQNDPDQLQDILDGLDLDLADYFINNSCVTGGSYWAGKDIAMVARAASISRAFGTTHYQTFDVSLRMCLDKWVRSDDTLPEADRLHYDTVWGGLLSRGVPDGDPFEPGANFGFPTYNDHHFHLGYWVYAMAYYAEFYPSWAEENEEQILYYVRDFANPSLTDTYFPFARDKDVYLGHSWASGIAGGTRTQESSTESIAGYHAVAALGNAMGNQVMEDIGRMLLATEIRSVRQYYHVRTDNAYHFPPLIRDYGAIGMFSEDAIFLYTLYWPCDPNWFPARHACLVGIQVIPITSISHYYMDEEWANSVDNVCSWSIDPTLAPGADQLDPEFLQPVSFGWGAFCLTAAAAKDAAATQRAADYIRGKGPRDFVSGTGAASTYLFLYGRT